MIIFNKNINFEFFIGSPKHFSLEARVFNSFCILAFFAMIINVPFNYSIALYVPSLICLGCALIVVALYYFSRVKRRFLLVVYLFGVISNVAFAINYFYNSGSLGPNLLVFSMIMLVVMVMVPAKQYIYWISLNFLLVISLLAFEYLYPTYILVAYRDSATRFLDYASTYLIMLLLIYCTISFIRKNYNDERMLVETQNQLILAQNLELEKINAEKDKLFSIVSHDIREPLNSILGYLTELGKTDATEQQKNHINESLLNITQNTSDMVANLLVWSKIQFHGTSVDLRAISIKAILQSSFKLEAGISLKKGIGFLINISEDLNILADINMLQIVLRNLVNNAIKFTPNGGLISISAINAHKDCTIKVADNGVGLSDDVKEKLFKLEAKSTYGTNNEKGIGLGLLLCKELTDLQGGNIWFEDNNKQGSVFCLSFPVVFK